MGVLTSSARLHIALLTAIAVLSSGACRRFASTVSVSMQPDTLSVLVGEARGGVLRLSDRSGRAVPLKRLDSIACSSSDSRIASVADSAVITGVVPGTVAVGCTVRFEGAFKSVSMVVRVVASEARLAIVPGDFSAPVGDTTLFFVEATGNSSLDPREVRWSVSDSSIASIDAQGAVCRRVGTTSVIAELPARGERPSAIASLRCARPTLPRPVFVQIGFAYDKTVVDPLGRDGLQAVVTTMTKDSTLRISVEGHSDDYASPPLDELLADARARNIVKTLERLAGDQWDALRSRVSWKSFGSRCPLVVFGEIPGAQRGKPERPSAAERSSRSVNRRVEISETPRGINLSADCRRASERRAIRLRYF